METAASGSAVASALLSEALAPLGAVAVAIWLTEPDGGMALIGEAGFGNHEASRWRRLHPDMRSLPQQVARDGMEAWWPAGPPAGENPVIVRRASSRCLGRLPLHDAGAPWAPWRSAGPSRSGNPPPRPPPARGYRRRRRPGAGHPAVPGELAA